MGLEQTARSVPLQQHAFARKTVLVLGKERDGISEVILQVLKPGVCCCKLVVLLHVAAQACGED